MEVIGVAASFIAIGQALVAGRHVVNLLRDIPRISNELASLSNEVESLRVAVEAAKMQGVIALGDDPEPPDLRLARLRIIETADELEKIRLRCTRTNEKDGKIKPRKTKWLFLQKELRECRDKARDARGSLQLALLTLNLRCTNQVAQLTLRLETFTIESSCHGLTGSQETMIPTSKRVCQADASSSDVVESSRPQNIASPIHDLQPSMTQLVVSNSDPSRYSPDADMVVFKAKLSAAGKCPQPCWCRCHSSRPSTFNSVGWARNLVGHLFVAYDRKIAFGSNVECSEILCKGTGQSVLTFNYQFPAWLCSRYISAQASIGSLTGLSASLRPVRVLPWHHLIIPTIEVRGREALQWCMQDTGLTYPDDRRHDGMSVLQFAIDYGTSDALEFLVEFWDDQLRKDNYNPGWHFAAKRQLKMRPSMPDQEAKALRKIIAFGEDTIDAVQTPLHEAACFVGGDVEAEQEIRNAFSKYPWAINQWNDEACTPLILASINGNIGAVRELIHLGCDLNCSGYDGKTALMEAAFNGHPKIVQYLLDEGCPVDTKAVDGRTALFDAVWPIKEPEGDPTEIMRILLSAGASATTQDMWGEIALHLLQDSPLNTTGTTEAKFRLLLEAGADINMRDNMGYTVLESAVRRNSEKTVRCLIEAGVELQVTGTHRRNLLHCAALFSRLECMEYLAKAKLSRMNTDMLDDIGNTTWDCFIYTIHSPSCSLGHFRQPNQEEIECFVSLYKNARERNLQLDIDRLQRTRQYLADKNQRGASAALGPLIKEKEDWEQWASLSTYKTILLQVREEMWEAAVESVDENIEVLKERIAQSPWDQKSNYDHLINSSSEGSEDEEDSLGSAESECQDWEEV